MSSTTIPRATRRECPVITSRQAVSPTAHRDVRVMVTRSDKITDEHLQRSAIVYVRQSTQQQVLEHRESTARQYALADRAVALGWPAAAVEVIDEDQGHSGSSAEGRSGFQRLLAEVSSDRVGLILGLEMSRLARSCKDWHALLELCAIYRTLLADADGLYDPSQYNDRLLLGLKGTMSEAELHILKSRLQQGMWNKAERGEVLNHAPIGYVRTLAGDFVIDPDEQVQAVVRLIFASVRAVWQRERVVAVAGASRCQAAGSPALRRQSRRTRMAAAEPRDAVEHAASSDLRRRLSLGASRSRSAQESTREAGQRPHVQRLRRMPGADSRSLFGVHHVGTIREKPAETERKQHARQTAGGPPSWTERVGGIGRLRSLRPPHARRLRQHVRAGDAALQLPAGCDRLRRRRCQSLSGAALESFVVERLLQAVSPASLELSLAASADIERERKQLDDHWQQRLARSRYEVEQARRQYAAVDPEHRLVARELERRWDESLRADEQLQADYAALPAGLPDATFGAGARSDSGTVPGSAGAVARRIDDARRSSKRSRGCCWSKSP